MHEKYKPILLLLRTLVKNFGRYTTNKVMNSDAVQFKT